MTYKTIVTIIPDAETGARVLDTAILVGSKNDSHIIAVHAEPSAAAYATPIGFPDAGVLETNIEEGRERARELKEKMTEKARAAGVSLEWRDMESFIGDSAVAALSSAYCADLVIAGQPEPGNAAAPADDVEALLFEGGRPVLFVPYAARMPSNIGRVLVAWNGTREAARATFDALPFLREADKVEVFTVDPPNNADQSSAVAGAEIAAVLARHGVEVSVEIADFGRRAGFRHHREPSGRYTGRHAGDGRLFPLASFRAPFRRRDAYRAQVDARHHADVALIRRR